MKLFDKLKRFLTYREGLRLPYEAPKVWSKDEHEHCYFKYIHEGRERIGQATGTYYEERERKGKKYVQKYIVANWHSPQWRIPWERVILLEKASEEIRLRYEVEMLRDKRERQADEITRLIGVQAAMQRRLAKSYRERLDETEFKKCLKLALTDPGNGMLDKDDRTRKFVSILYKMMKEVKNETI